MAPGGDALGMPPAIGVTTATGAGMREPRGAGSSYTAETTSQGSCITFGAGC
jgi:hypothetical protein